jgi:hypothetical protein
VVQAGLGKKQDPISKITRAKWARGIVQVVAYLPSKNEALSTNLSTKSKKRKKKKKDAQIILPY